MRCWVYFLSLLGRGRVRGLVMRRLQRKLHDELRSRSKLGQHVDVATHGFNDLPHDEEPESQSTVVPG